MRLVILIISLLFCTFLFSQNDTSKIYNASKFKKGFYKSYQEYINNSPSLVNEFTIEILYKRKLDSSAICVDFTLVNIEEEIGRIWGFCDGKDVYVKRFVGLSTSYWRVINIGIHPLYYYYERSTGFGPGIIRLVSFFAFALADVDLILAVKDERDKSHNVNERNVKNLLLNYPELSKQFEEDLKAFLAQKDNNSGVKKIDICKEYILKLEKIKRSY